MRTIETTATIAPDGTLTAHVPPDVPPGEHPIVVMIDEASEETRPPLDSPAHDGSPAGRSRPPLDLPVDDVGPWPPGLSLRREDMYDEWGR